MFTAFFFFLESGVHITLTSPGAVGTPRRRGVTPDLKELLAGLCGSCCPRALIWGTEFSLPWGGEEGEAAWQGTEMPLHPGRGGDWSLGVSGQDFVYLE